MNRIRLTESQLHRVIKESVRKILKEGNWADGTPQQKAYFITSLENTEEDGEAYHLYDSITHNEISIDDAIQEICGGNPSSIGEGELETVPRDLYIMGYSRDGRYFITYDGYSGDLDVYEKDLKENINNKNKGKYLQESNMPYTDEDIAKASLYSLKQAHAKLQQIYNTYMNNSTLSQEYNGGRGIPLDKKTEDIFDKIFNLKAEIDILLSDYE